MEFTEIRWMCLLLLLKRFQALTFQVKLETLFFGTWGSSSEKNFSHKKYLIKKEIAWASKMIQSQNLCPNQFLEISTY